MQKSPPIRAAVNLCVIGAILVSAAGLVGVTRGACDQEVASTETCPDCGCCAVAHAGERCGCCNHADPPRRADGDTAEMSCCAEDDTAPLATEHAANSPGICMCGKANPEPAVPPTEGRTAPEQLVRTLLEGYSAIVPPGAELSAHAFCWADATPPALLPGDAQRRFGVWRI